MVIWHAISKKPIQFSNKLNMKLYNFNKNKITGIALFIVLMLLLLFKMIF